MAGRKCGRDCSVELEALTLERDAYGDLLAAIAGSPKAGDKAVPAAGIRDLAALVLAERGYLPFGRLARMKERAVRAETVATALRAEKVSLRGRLEVAEVALSEARFAASDLVASRCPSCGCIVLFGDAASVGPDAAEFEERLAAHRERTGCHG
jgi:hypothetical protein